MPGWNERVHVLDYDSAVALRYHGCRKEFFSALSRADPALSIVLGSAAFATVLLGHKWLAAASGLAVAFVSAVDLAFGLGDRARRHEDLFRRWGALRADLPVLDENDECALRLLEVKRAQIDAESPWQLEALSVLCENEERLVRRDATSFHVGWMQRALANWFTLPGWQPTEERVPPPAQGMSNA